MCSTDIFLGLLALLFPPIAVWVKCGICSADSIINILLCVLGYLPGLIHAWYIIAKYPEPTYEYEGPADAEGGHIYVFVRDGHGGHRSQRVNQQPRPAIHGGNMNYGSTAASQQPGQVGAGPKPVSMHTPQPGPQQHAPQESGAGPSDGPAPPSYAQVVAAGGDHKVQTQD
ncbi:hypothetical protein B0H66DRAFT_602767 [Apodospora peruviana]|uniref:Stress response RCI peptide n=1 Tax=Apodospora peruviana TaxID=516989 RepID=A0AAE0M3N0_9PEZI|nr:hypothetical protein B0H66DRAFT_602767 [Apodospora peruviana]